MRYASKLSPYSNNRLAYTGALAANGNDVEPYHNAAETFQSMTEASFIGFTKGVLGATAYGKGLLHYAYAPTACISGGSLSYNGYDVYASRQKA